MSSTLTIPSAHIVGASAADEHAGERGALVERTKQCRSTDLDVQTLKLAQAGNRAALGRFVEHYQDAVYGFLSRSLTHRRHRLDDLAQEVFLRAIRALPRFEQRDARVLTWLLQIAVRLLQDEGRKRTLLSDALEDEQPALEPDPMQRASARQELTIVERAAARLPEEQRVALVLQEFHGLSHAEIAKATGTSVATVKTRVHRARAFLAEALSAAGQTNNGARRPSP